MTGVTPLLHSRPDLQHHHASGCRRRCTAERRMPVSSRGSRPSQLLLTPDAAVCATVRSDENDQPAMSTWHAVGLNAEHRPNSLLVWSDLSDVARSCQRPAPSSAPKLRMLQGRLNNWREPAEMRADSLAEVLRQHAWPHDVMSPFLHMGPLVPLACATDSALRIVTAPAS
jgi:GTP-dependent phosphoenolpyruvate carboxykinase